MLKESFYAECAAILGVDYEYLPSLGYRRRWGQRLPGNGRFRDIGLIRMFGPTCIHVAIEGSSRTFKSQDETFKFLRGIV